MEAALAWQWEQQLLCSGCGLPKDESMAKERQFAYEGRVLRCHACKAAAHAAKKFQDGPHDPAGIVYSVSELDG